MDRSMYKKLIVWALWLLAAVPAAHAEQEFLKPDQAFVISAQSSDGRTVQVNWQIAEGYY
ncbi:MAG: protein-disulfide reductase DsbD domain-containing protein, partial [Sedimenticolaceae bacterium]